MLDLLGCELVRLAGRPGERVGVLDAEVRQQPERPRRAGRLTLPASGPDPQVTPQSARAVSPLAFRHHGDRRPTAAAGLGAGRLPGRLELVGRLATQFIQPGHGLPVMRLTSGRCRNRLADSVSSSYRSRPALAQHIPGGPTGGCRGFRPVAFCSDQAEPAWHPG